MRKSYRLVCLLTVLTLLLSPVAEVWASFPDTAGTRFEDAAGYLQQLGVVVGDPDGSFRPQTGITRAEVAKIIVALVGADDVVDAASAVAAFPDTAGHWANGYIRAARDLGIINGFPDGMFRPEAKVTYAQMVKMLVEASDNGPMEGLAWPDNYLTAAQARGMLAGVPGLAANDPASRGDCAILAAFAARHVPGRSTGLTLAQRVFGRAATLTLTPEEHECWVGTTVTLKAVVRNAAGNLVAGLPIGWSVTNPAKATVSQTGKFIASAPGEYRVVARCSGLSATSTITVSGAPTALRATPEAQTVTATGQSKARITVEVVDSWGNLVSEGPDVEVSIGYASGGNNGAVSIGETKKTTDDGKVTFEVTAKTRSGRTDTLVFRADGLDADKVKISTVAQVASSIELTAVPSSLQNNVSAVGTVTATILDQSGVKMASSSGSVVFTISGAGTFANKSVAAKTRSVSNGVATIDIYSIAGTTGKITVTASLTGLPIARLQIGTHTAGDPEDLRARVADNTVLAGETSPSGNVAKFQVEMVDTRGRLAASDVDVRLTVLLDDGSPLSSIGLKASGDLKIDAGHTSTGDIFILAAGTRSGQVGTYRLEVVPDHDDLSPARLSVTVEPSGARFLKTDLTENAKLSLGALTIPVTVQVVDIVGNPIGQSGLEVRAGWQDPGTSNHGKPTINGVYNPPTDARNSRAVTAKTDSSGKATFTFKAEPYMGDDYRLEFRSGSMAVNTATLTVVNIAAGSTSAKIVNASGSSISRVRADDGQTAFLEVLVKDGYDHPLPGWDVAIQFSNEGLNVRDVSITMGMRIQSYDDGKLVVRTVSAPGAANHGKVGVSFEGSVAGSYTITVKPSGAVPSAIAERTFRTDPGNVMTGLRLYTADGKAPKNLTLQADTPYELRLVASDYGGNAVQVPVTMNVLVSHEDGLYCSSTAGEFRLHPTKTAVDEGEYITLARGSTQKTIYYVQPEKQTGVSFGIRDTKDAYVIYKLRVSSAEIVDGSPDTAKITFLVRDAEGVAMRSVRLYLDATEGTLSGKSGTTNADGKLTVTWTGGAGGVITATVLDFDLGDGSHIEVSEEWPEP